MRQLVFLAKNQYADNALLNAFALSVVSVVVLVLSEGHKIFKEHSVEQFVYELMRGLVEMPVSSILAKCIDDDSGPAQRLHEAVRWIDKMVASIGAHIQSQGELEPQVAPSDAAIAQWIREAHQTFRDATPTPRCALESSPLPQTVLPALEDTLESSVEVLTRLVITDYREVVQILPNLKN